MAVRQPKSPRLPSRQAKQKRLPELLALCGVLLVGLALRSLYLREFVGTPEFSAPVIDPGFHDYWARALVTGDWTPPEHKADPLIRTTPFFRPPGYPYFLALVYRLAGLSYVAPRIVQMALGLLSCVLAFLLGRRWYGRITALIFAALMATYWQFIYFEGEFLEPALLIFLLLSFVYVLSLWTERLAPGYCFGAGLLLGVSALVKPNPLLFVPIGVAWIWWIARRRRKTRRSYPGGMGFVLGVVIAVAPVTIRNYRAARDFVLISSNLGINLYIGNNEYADGSVVWDIPGFGRFRTCYQYPAIVKQVEEELGKRLKYSEVSAHYAGKAFSFIREHPLDFIRLTVRKAFLFWGPAEISHNKEINCERDASSTLGNIPGNFPFALSLSLVGILRLALDVRSERRAAALSPEVQERLEVSILIPSFVLVFFASYLPFVNAALYRVPIVPFLFLFGAYGIYRVGQFLWARDVRSSAIWVLWGSVLYVAAAWPFVPYHSPGPAVWHAQRCRAYLNKGKADRAIEECREALRFAPDSIEAHSVLAEALGRQRRIREAIDHEAAALRLSGPDAQRLGRLGTALCQVGRLDEGMARLREALRLDPGSAEAHANLAIALKLQGRIAEAAEELRYAVRLRPDDPAHRERLGVALCEQGMIDEGTACFREALRLDPTFAEAYASLAVALKLQGDLGESLRQARKALRLEPHKADRHCLVADLLWSQGRFEEAAAQYRQALRIDPRHARAQKHLERLLSGSVDDE